MSLSEPAPSAPPWMRMLRAVLMILAIGFIGVAIADLARRWEPAELRIQPWWLICALLPAFLAPLLQAWGWIRLIEHLSGRTVPTWRALELYFDSQLARYTPGKVGLPAVRMAGAGRLGVGAGLVGTSILVELLSWLALGGVVGLVLLLGGAVVPDGLVQMLARFAGLLLVLAVLGVALLLVVDRNRLPGFVRRFLRLEGQGSLVPWSVPLAHALHWMAWGAHGSLLALALGASLSAAFTVGGVTCLAIVLGFVAFLAPAGAGVREAVIGLGAAPLLGAPAAVAVGVLARGASLLADVVLWFLVRLWGRARGDVAGELP